jgi:serine/threonine protein kinase
MDRSKAVAIKSPRDAIEEDEPADTSELLHEAQFLEACGGHPSIVSFHDIIGDYVTYKLSLVLEYVRGQSLDIKLSLRRNPKGSGCALVA